MVTAAPATPAFGPGVGGQSAGPLASAGPSEDALEVDPLSLLFTPYQDWCRVGPGEVHAWLVDLDGDAGPAYQVLDDCERDRAAGYLRALDGARFAASRGALRRILGRYVGRAPQHLELQTDPHGRPRLAGYDLQFSLARSAARALVAISRGPVGADLERIESRPGLADLAAARFGVADAACVARACAGSPLQAFYRHWTAKEAYLKAVGCGLGRLREAELDCDGPPTIRFGGRPAIGWALSIMNAPAGYAGAIAASQPVAQWRRITA